MRPRQDEVFSAFEGDNWFRRNRPAIERFDPEHDLPLKLIRLYGISPAAVLEVGAANGYRLAELAECYGARAVAVEPSADARADGERRYPAVTFLPGALDAIPTAATFDLVIINFVFHWVDRSRLLRAVAEIDRVVADNGFLIIGDFHPSNQLRVPYHHLPAQEIYTYKQNYAATFLTSGLYHPVCLLTGIHDRGQLTTDVTQDALAGVWLLRKSLEGHYVERSQPV